MRSRVVVAPRPADDRIGELADCLGIPPAAPLQLDGRPVARHETLARAGVVRGSTLGVAAPHVVAGRGARRRRRRLRCGSRRRRPRRAGPRTPRRRALARCRRPSRRPTRRGAPRARRRGDGRHGRRRPAHGAGPVPPRRRADRLAGGRPARRRADDGRQPPARRPAPGPRCRSGGRRGGPGRSMAPRVRRTPRPVPRWSPEPIPVPAMPQPAGAARVGAGSSPRCSRPARRRRRRGRDALPAVPRVRSGRAARLGRGVAGVVGDHRARRAPSPGRGARPTSARSPRPSTRNGTARRAHHDATTPGVTEAIAAAMSVRADVWCRRAGHDDVHRAALGQGVVEWPVALTGDPSQPLAPELAALVRDRGRLDDAAVPVELGPGAALAIAGRAAGAVARALVVQLATWSGPADLRLVVVAADPAAWDWCRWLPHALGADGPRVVAGDDAERLAGVLRALDDGSARHVLVVTDRADMLSQRTGPLRRFLGAAPSAAVVAVVGADGATPAMCRSVLEIGSLGTARWWADASVDAHPVAVHAAGVTVAVATSVARSLAALVDPEEAGGPGPVIGAATALGPLTARHGPGPIDDPIAIAGGVASRRAGPGSCRRPRGDRRRRRRDRPRARRSPRPRRRDDGIGQERAAAHPRRVARRSLRARSPHVRARRLQGRRHVRRLCRAAAHRRARHGPRRRARRRGR